MILEQLIHTVFTVSLGIFFYSYIGYPVFLWFLSLFFSTKEKQTEKIQNCSIAVCIAAYNEEDSIAECIDAVLASELQHNNSVHIFIGSDGSTDETNTIVREYCQCFQSITLIILPRGGKNKALNSIVSKIDSSEYPFLIFLDADIRVKPSTIDQLLSKFTSNSIGAVLARRTHSEINDTTSTVIISEGIYQQLEFFIQKHESKIWSTVNAFGPCYAFRTKFFTPIPSTAVCDDFYITNSVNIQKKRVVLAEGAEVVEVRDRSVERDFKRRIRTVSGGLATIASLRTLLNPFTKWVGFFIWSHKVLRWFTPIYLLLIVSTSFFLETSFFKLYFIIFEIGIGLLSALLFYLEDKVEILSKIKVLGYFFSLNIAMLFGIFEFIQGKATSVWSNSSE